MRFVLLYKRESEEGKKVKKGRKVWAKDKVHTIKPGENKIKEF